MTLELTAIALMAAGIFLIGREVWHGRPASNAALAGDVLVIAGSACLAASWASGPLWPLACVPALASLAFAVSTAAVARTRRKGLSR